MLGSPSLNLMNTAFLSSLNAAIIIALCSSFSSWGRLSFSPIVAIAAIPTATTMQMYFSLLRLCIRLFIGELFPAIIVSIRRNRGPYDARRKLKRAATSHGAIHDPLLTSPDHHSLQLAITPRVWGGIRTDSPFGHDRGTRAQRSSFDGAQDDGPRNRCDVTMFASPANTCFSNNKSPAPSRLDRPVRPVD